MNKEHDLIIIGGGVGGLTSAALATRAGLSAVVMEPRPLGGRARSPEVSGVPVDLGAHALYAGGAAEQILSRLNITLPLTAPPLDRGTLAMGEEFVRMPSSPFALLRSELPFRTKRALAMFLMFPPKPYATVREWLATITDDTARSIVAALVRLSTYDGDFLDADATPYAAQLKQSIDHGVGYLPRFSMLVDALRAAAPRVPVIRSAVAEVMNDGAVHTRDGKVMRAGHVILAMPAPDAAKLFSPLGPYAATARAIRAASLDVVLHGALPVPSRALALSTDRALYFTSRVTEHGDTVLHVLGNHVAGKKPSRQELESFLSEAQPGWRERVRGARFLSSITVAHKTPSPPPSHPRVSLVCDTTGDGMLCDAVMSSARHAIDHVLQRAERSRDALRKRVSRRSQNSSDARPPQSRALPPSSLLEDAVHRLRHADAPIHPTLTFWRRANFENGSS